jgi:hypothetical protein
MDIRSGLNVSYTDPGENPYSRQDWYKVEYDLALGMETPNPQLLNLPFHLGQNHPNPFSGKTEIHYELSRPGFIGLRVFNALGQEVAELVNADQAAGSYTASWDASGFADGSYYYQLKVGNSTQIKKMVLTQ